MQRIFHGLKTTKKMTPQEYLEKKGIRKTTYNGVRLVSDTDHMYKVTELMAWYADSEKSSDISRISQESDSERLLEAWIRQEYDDDIVIQLKMKRVKKFLASNCD